MPYSTYSPSAALGATIEVSEIESLAKGSLIAGDGTGAPATLAVGTNAKVLTANSAEATGLEWATPATGNVTKVGTPVNNQVGVWTGDGTLEGDTALTFDTTTDTLTSVAFAGDLTGNVTGNASGTAATVTGATQASITTLANLVSVQGRTVTLADAGANAIFGWDDTAGAYENLSQAEVLAVIGSMSTTAQGVVEAAITSEVDTGTSATLAVTPDSLAGSYAGTKVIEVVVFDYTTDATTGDGKAYFTIPPSVGGMDLVGIHGRVITAGTTGTLTIQLRNVTQATDFLSTRLTIDSAETGSDTAAAAAVIDTANDDVAAYDLIAVDSDVIHTTASKGLILVTEWRLP